VVAVVHGGLDAGEVGPEDHHALAVWTALAASAPEEALARLLTAVRFHLAGGGYRGRRAAADFLRAAAKIAYATGGEEHWGKIRAALREEFGPLLRGPELGALLAQEGRDIGPEA